MAKLAQLLERRSPVVHVMSPDQPVSAAVEVMARRLDVPVKSIASLEDVMRYLDADEAHASAREMLLAYQQRYCAMAG